MPHRKFYTKILNVFIKKMNKKMKKRSTKRIKMEHFLLMSRYLIIQIRGCQQTLSQLYHKKGTNNPDRVYEREKKKMNWFSIRHWNDFITLVSRQRFFSLLLIFRTSIFCFFNFFLFIFFFSANISFLFGHNTLCVEISPTLLSNIKLYLSSTALSFFLLTFFPLKNQFYIFFSFVCC